MKFYHPLILFLDKDPVVSASYLSNRFLFEGIRNSCQLMVCANLYNVGLRNRNIGKILFSKDRKDETVRKYFPDWPLKEAPKYTFYQSVESKWIRKCKNHYDIVQNYMEAMLDEYTFRTGKEHELSEMFDFLMSCPYEISLRFGYPVAFIQNLKIVYPWKNLPLKYRKKDIIEGYRQYYKSQIFNPYEEYMGTKRDIPSFVLEGRGIDEFTSTPIN